MKSEQIRAFLRDAACMVTGIGGIAYQQRTGDVDVALLGVYLSLMGSPAVLGVVAMLRRSGDGSGTRSSPSPSPEEPQAVPSPRRSSEE